jgi:hypothetical protein
MGVVELAVVMYFAGERGGHCLWDLLYGDPSGGDTVSAQANLPVRAWYVSGIEKKEQDSQKPHLHQ